MAKIYPPANTWGNKPSRHTLLWGYTYLIHRQTPSKGALTHTSRAQVHTHVRAIMATETQPCGVLNKQPSTSGPQLEAVWLMSFLPPVLIPVHPSVLSSQTSVSVTPLRPLWSLTTSQLTPPAGHTPVLVRVPPPSLADGSGSLLLPLLLCGLLDRRTQSCQASFFSPPVLSPFVILPRLRV